MKQTSSQSEVAAPQVSLLGEPHPFLQQLGSMDGLITLTTASSSLQRPAIKSYQDLSDFLVAYLKEILLPQELPAIYQAYSHAARNESRELISLDQQIAKAGIHKDFASASRRVGRSHLQRLRPLRGERFVQRYLRAVEDNKAQAWHTIVFGLTMAIYSLPVRQGLITYARQTLSSFIQTAAKPLRLTVDQCQGLLQELTAALPAQIERIVSPAAN